MTAVVVLGPNLSYKGAALGEMHVHREGCGDLRRYGRFKPFGGDGEGWKAEVASAEDVVRVIYPPEEFDYAPEEWKEFAGGIYIAPCVKFEKVVQ